MVIATCFGQSKKENLAFDSILAKEKIETFFSDKNCSHESIYSFIEQIPEYNGSINGLDQWIPKQVKYPGFAQENEIQGNVLIHFIVNEDGSVTCPKLIKSSHPALTLEAIRIFNQMKKWTPGKQSGEVVKCIQNFFVQFKLD